MPVEFYSRVIFPRICNFLLNNPLVGQYRRRLLVQAQGNILEIGFGTGLNLPYYPGGIRRITTIDPNPGMQKLARRQSSRRDIDVDHYAARSEQLPFGNNRFDCVVSTFTLCSVLNVTESLREVYRVLLPGGRFLYLEHGRSPEPAIQKWQRRLNWLQQLCGDGCRLDRNIHELVGTQPFSSLERSNEYLSRTPRTHGYLYVGIATK